MAKGRNILLYLFPLFVYLFVHFLQVQGKLFVRETQFVHFGCYIFEVLHRLLILIVETHHRLNGFGRQVYRLAVKFKWLIYRYFLYFSHQNPQLLFNVLLLLAEKLKMKRRHLFIFSTHY